MAPITIGSPVRFNRYSTIARSDRNEAAAQRRYSSAFAAGNVADTSTSSVQLQSAEECDPLATLRINSTEDK